MPTKEHSNEIWQQSKESNSESGRKSIWQPESPCNALHFASPTCKQPVRRQVIRRNRTSRLDVTLIDGGSLLVGMYCSPHLIAATSTTPASRRASKSTRALFFASCLPTPFNLCVRRLSRIVIFAAVEECLAPLTTSSLIQMKSWFVLRSLSPVAHKSYADQTIRPVQRCFYRLFHEHHRYGWARRSRGCFQTAAEQ